MRINTIKLIIYLPICILLLLSCDKNKINYEGIKIGDYERSDVNYEILPIESLTNYNEIDINNDGKIDFKISEFYMSSPMGVTYGSGISILDTNFSICIKNTNNTFLQKNDIISNKLLWQNNDITFYSYYAVGPSPDPVIKENFYLTNNEGYIGIKYNKNSTVKFGWIKVINSLTTVKEIVIEK